MVQIMLQVLDRCPLSWEQQFRPMPTLWIVRPSVGFWAPFVSPGSPKVYTFSSGILNSPEC